MLEENATNAGGNDSLPTSAPAAPPVPTSPAPAATAPAKVSSPMGASPEQPAPLPVSPAAPSRSFMGALAHALIGSTMAVAAKGVKAIAGPAPVDYSTDASGKTVGTPRTDNTRSRLERLAQHALEGLAAGSQIGPQKSVAAAWGAGIGAGAKAELGQAQQQDLLKRQQAQEDYETQQKTILHKATVAMTNAQTHATWQKFGDDENARDTERQKNMGIVNSLNDFTAQNPTSKLTVQTLTEEQAMAMREADAHTVAKHTFLPIGKVQAKDANGNDVYEADGQTPKFTKQFAAISGSADEKIPLPQVMADDLKKYAKYDPRLKSFAQVQAGTMVPFTGFLTAYKYATEDKGREADGWRESKPGENAGSVNGKIVQHNPFTGDTREYAGGVPLAVKKEQAEIAEKESAAKKNLADAAAKAQDGLSTNADRAVIAESMRKGRMDPSQLSKRSKDYNAVLAEADKQEMEETGQHFNIAQAQTDFKYANNAQTKNTLNMINGMTEPNGAIDIASRAASRLPKMNSKTANQVFNITKTEFGDSSLTDFHTAMLGLADEYSKVMGGGVSSDTGRQQSLDILKENYSKGQLAGAIQIMKSDISARKKAIVGKNRYLLQEYGEDQTGSQGGQPQNGRPASTPAASTSDPFAQFGAVKWRTDKRKHKHRRHSNHRLPVRRFQRFHPMVRSVTFLLSASTMRSSRDSS